MIAALVWRKEETEETEGTVLHRGAEKRSMSFLKRQKRLTEMVSCAG